MKKTNVVKILECIFLLFILSLICSNKVQAVEASLSANNCNVGESFTVTVNIPQDVSAYDIGGVTVTYSDGSTQSSSRKVGVNLDLSWPGNYSVSFPGKVAGNARISVNGVILSNSSNAVVNTVSNLETTVTIIDNTPPAEPEPSQTSDNSESGNEASVELSFRDTNEKMYTIRRVNVRQNYGTDSGIIQTLAEGTEVTRTGIGSGTKDGYSWSRISYNGITGYMITSALTDEAPAPAAPPAEEEKPVEEKKEENPEEKKEENKDVKELSEADKAIVAKLAEKYGSIPEVGVNIMPFFFLGSCVSCITIMIYMKKYI